MRRASLVALWCLWSTIGGAAISRAASAQRAIAVSGVVWDSVSGRPLSGASLQLVGIDSALAGLATSSDATGRFRFAAVPPGRYLLGFYHSALDTIGIEPLGRLVDVRTEDQDLVLAGPSAKTMVRAFCGDSVPADRLTLLLGHLHNAETESAIASGNAIVTWSEARVVGAAVHLNDRSAVATSRRDGWFAVCGLPVATALELRGAYRTDSSAAVALRFTNNSVQHLSLFIGATSTRLRARIAGRVTASSGRPVSGAQVSATSTERRTVTDASGSYQLDDLPIGTQSLEIRAIGYSPRTVIVTLSTSGATRDFTLEQAVVLPTVTTLGAKSSKNLATFEAHKRSSAGGFFIKPTRLEDYPALQTLHMLVQGLPNANVKFVFGEWAVEMFRPSTYIGASPKVPCTPQMFLNGTKTFLSFGDLDSMIDPDDLLGVEVYTREIQIPSVYALPINRPCGLVSVWTRAADEPTRVIKPTPPR